VKGSRLSTRNLALRIIRQTGKKQMGLRNQLGLLWLERESTIPEVSLQLCGGEVDHGTETVNAGTGQSPPNALLNNVEDVIYHTGCQLALLIGVQSHSLPKSQNTQ
jgi:hypothetical protein